MPKIIWYNLNSSYNLVVANTLENFHANEEGIKSQMQFGTAWWFNDHKEGMLDQIKVYAEQGVFSNFSGMLTDSRSFLSYQRHDYFRKLLCLFVGTWIDEGDMPDDEVLLLDLLKNISHRNINHIQEEI